MEVPVVRYLRGNWFVCVCVYFEWVGGGGLNGIRSVQSTAVATAIFTDYGDNNTCTVRTRVQQSSHRVILIINTKLYEWRDELEGKR